MKRYIRSSTDSEILEYNIDVYIDVTNLDETLKELQKYINASIEPPYRADKSIDEQALADYDAFVSNVYALLCYYFDIADIEESTKSATSWYFWIYGKREDGTVATKILCRLRLSDHDYSSNHNKTDEKAWVNEQAQSDKLKRPKSKRKQNWILKNIVVNDTTYDSYDDALDSIEADLEALSKRLVNKGD